MSVLQSFAVPECGCDAPELASGLISHDEARRRIAQIPTRDTGGALIALDQAMGRVLAQPVVAVAPLPGFDHSAMDGYALSVQALKGEGPWVLKVTDRVRAGAAAQGSVAGMTAARIFTGAPIPPGADCVIMQEKVQRFGDRIRITQRPASGENIRRAGEELAAGTEVLGAGARLGPREIAGCAAVGATDVSVRRRLKVALLVTGDELRPMPGRARDQAAICDINTPMLRAELSRCDLDVVEAAHAADSREDVTRQIAALGGRVDLLITTGGLSVGEEDHVRPAFDALGGETLFSGVAIKPGKPVSLGRLGGCHWLGLPGNPMAALVTWQLFGTVLVDRLTGAEARRDATRQMVLAQAVSHRPGRCEFRSARIAGCDGLGRTVVLADGATHSNRVTGLARCDGMIVIPGDADHLPEGALVDFIPFPGQ